MWHSLIFAAVMTVARRSHTLPSMHVIGRQPGWCTFAPLMVAGDDSIDMDALASRIDQAKGEFVRLFVADALVPHQRLQFVAPAPAVANFQYASSTPLVMIGRYPYRLHTHGVEVSVSLVAPRPTGEADVILSAGRLCEVTELGLKQDVANPWMGRDARVRWLSPDDEDDVSARLIARSEALGRLSDEWLDKVRRSEKVKERFVGQLDGVLSSLGPMPPAGAA